MYKSEIWDIDYPAVILKRFILSFEKLDVAITFAELHTKNGQGYTLQHNDLK